MIGKILAFTVVAGSMSMNVDNWAAVNDGVMGGVSLGEIVATDEGLRFQGELSLENNGGFASVRRQLDSAQQKIHGFRLDIQGDGRDYQFRLRTDDKSDGVSWRVVFKTTGEPQQLEFRAEDFEPVFRGRKVRTAGSLDPAKIRQLGFLIADGKPGSFQLDITGIQFLP